MEDSVNGTKDCFQFEERISFVTHIFEAMSVALMTQNYCPTKGMDRKRNEILKLKPNYKTCWLINLHKYHLIKESSPLSKEYGECVASL